MTVRWDPYGYPWIKVAPHAGGARFISLVADQWISLVIGDGPGGRWELDYSEEGIDFAKKAISAVVHSHVEVRRALRRSSVTLTFEDGSSRSETGYTGLLAPLIPLPGWLRWGEHVRTAPYL